MHESRRARTHTSGGSRYATARGTTANGPRQHESPPGNGKTRPGTSKGSFHRLGTAKASARVEPEGGAALVSGTKRRILRKGRSFGKHDVVEVKEDEPHSPRSHSTTLMVPDPDILIVHDDPLAPEPPPPSTEVTVVAQIEPIPKNLITSQSIDEQAEAPPPEPSTTVPSKGPSPTPSVPHVETGEIVIDQPEKGENEDAEVVVIKGKDSSDVFMIEVPVEHEAIELKELKAEDLDKEAPRREVNREQPRKTRRTTSKKSLKSVRSHKSVRSLDSRKKDQEDKIAPAAPDPAPSVPEPEAKPPEEGAPSEGQPRPPVTRGKFAGIARTMKFLRSNRVADSSATAAQNDFMSRHGMSGVQANKEGEEQFQGSLFEYLRTKWVCDKSSDFHYWWTAVMSIAFLYNLIVVIARVVFSQLSDGNWRFAWLATDIVCDLVYLMDMWIKSRTGFLEQGLLVRDLKKVRTAYIKSPQYRADLISMIPLDLLAAVVTHFTGRYFKQIDPFPVLRITRLMRYNRFSQFVERTETRSPYPNAFRVSCVIWYIIIIIHWNACFYFFISVCIGLGTDAWVYGERNHQSLPKGVEDTLTRRYIYSFYWSTLILTTIGEVPGPVHNMEFLFVTCDLMCGVLIFATIVGNVGSMISNMGAAKTEFQNKMDAIKQYMELRNVSKQLELRVIKWFDYLWANKQGLSDAEVLKILPDKLQAEIAMHVHFETLRKDCEAGLLAELVLKLQLQVFSPNDFVCKVGDIGREMYIVKRGKLKIMKDDGTLLTYMSEGAVFGELSILNIPGSKNGNRRTANIMSIGYSDLFVLSKNDLMNALKEYPEAKNMLMKKGREILRRDNLLDENAPEEQRSSEEMCDDLMTKVKNLQIKLARLTAEYTSTTSKLRDRITYLERQLDKYGVPDPGPLEPQPSTSKLPV
ncbi:hypothetical protein QR680_014924 [Steinernema hermaphroditum]|uniref:Cyclic nucleotide-binding domain-containing protein n=1 Tax=Steinernema hermaphroditum TaxID=289476 RepID=A0AA39IC47_9BILA|nr:hypothetical protein QR680_014924 [Steinernema hermaphroditum]